PDAPLSGRVRIVSDQATNSLLISANALDKLSIKRMLAQLDVPHGESDAEVLNYIIALKHTKADDIAKIIADVYATKGRQAAPPSFSVGVDSRTNSLIVRGSQIQVKEVKALIDQLDVPK